jgi:hypothetical protein
VAEEQQRVRDARICRELREQPALAHSRVATDENRCRPAAGALDHGRTKRRELVGPADEPGHRRLGRHAWRSLAGDLSGRAPTLRVLDAFRAVRREVERRAV